MNLQDILQKIRLKLEHHPLGQFIMLLVFPFYARPHHFRDKETSILSRIAFFAPLGIAWMFAEFTNSSVLKLIERQYATMNFVTAQVADTFDQAGRTTFLITLLCITLFIYFVAAVELGWDHLARRIWQKFTTHQIEPAPYAYYITCWSSMTAWFLVMAHATMYIVKNGIVHTQEVILQAFENYPYAILFLLIALALLQQIKNKNALSSAMEIYGSLKIVAMNSVLIIMLALSTLFLYLMVPKLINS